MKRLQNILFPLLLLMAAGCSKNAVTTVDNSSSAVPNGNFLGPFTLIHKNSSTGKSDTSSALITVAFNISTASYSVAGDTSKIQAPSYGTYTADGTIITFADATVTKRTSANAPKKHLTGGFLYTYDGTKLHIYGSSDTLSFNYNLMSY
jgi:hypothetical protein